MKNSDGKNQAYIVPLTSTGKRRQDRLMVLGDYTHREETSVISTGLLPESSITQNCQPTHLAYLPVTGTRAASKDISKLVK